MTRQDRYIDEWNLNLHILGPDTLEARNILFGLSDAVNNVAPQPATPILPTRRRPGRPSRRELELRNAGTPQTPPLNDLHNLQQQIQAQVQQQLQQHMQQFQPAAGPAPPPITGIRCGLCQRLTADHITNTCRHFVCSGCIPRLLSCPICNRAIPAGALVPARR